MEVMFSFQHSNDIIFSIITDISVKEYKIVLCHNFSKQSAIIQMIRQANVRTS